MSRLSRQSPTSAQIKFSSLKNCLVNLPQSLINVITTTDAPVQDVIVEILLQEKDKDGKHVQRSIYTGWSGMHSLPAPKPNRSEYGFSGKESGRETVDIDPTFGRALGLKEGQRIGLLLHLEPPLAHTVHIEPLTLEDWEVIELHANFLELNLLSQVRALPNPSFSGSPTVQAQHAHPLTLHLSPTSTASIIVTSLTPAPASSVAFAKLAPDAEAIVAPKTRPRLGERRVSRSVISNGRKSAAGRSTRSSGQRRPVSDQNHTPKALLLRPCDRKFCNETFHDYDDSSQDNVGLRLWVDPETSITSGWSEVSYVSVSLVNPAGLKQAGDTRQQQQRKESEIRDSEKATSNIIAELLPYFNAPTSMHAVLSSQLCSSLNISGIVGGIVEVKAAPLPVPKNTIQNLLFLPFLSTNGKQDDSIRLGDHSRVRRQRTLKDFVDRPGSREATSLLQGGLTDGMIIPSPESVDQSNPWTGGILRFAWRPRTKGESEPPSLVWVNGLDEDTPLEFGNEVANPLQVGSSNNDGLPDKIAPLIGLEKLSNQLYSSLSHSSSIFLTGGLGSGKTSLARLVGCQLRDQLQCHVSYMSCRKVVVDEVRVSAVKDSIEQLFTIASWATRLGGQALVILDDLDKLCPVVTELQTQDNSRSNQISELLCNITRRYCARTSGVTRLATAQSQDSLNSLLVGANLFKDIVSIKAPDKDGRRKLLQAMVGESEIRKKAIDGMNGHAIAEGLADQAGWMDDSLPPSPTKSSAKSEVVRGGHLDLFEIAGRTDGYMPADLLLLVSRAKSEALVDSVATDRESSEGFNMALSNQDFDRALKGFTPASLRNVTLQSSNITFESIGGLKTIRKILLETLQYPTLYVPIFARCPLRLRSGLLLYGYPGCGKTLLASAVAGECGLNFISVKGPEILNKYIGASEKSVRDLFDRAESARPCVLFFDEFDSIAPKRGHDSTGVTDRVVNQLLTQMDGAEGLSGVYVLAATSRPDLIDPALLRPGRLDKSILCDLPDFDDRLDIVNVISKKLKMDPKILSSQRQGLYEVAQRTEGYSGADLQAVIYNAHLEAIHDELGDSRADGKIGKKNQMAKHGGSSTESDILQFRFGKDVDAESRSSGSNRARETAEYRATIEKLEAIRRTRRIERRKMRQSLSEKPEEVNGANERGDKGTHEVVIQWRHIEASLSSTRSSISPQERERLRRFYTEFTIGRSGELPNGEGSTEVGGRSSLM